MADFDFVTPRIATGAAINSIDDVHELASVGITHVVDCRAEFDDTALLSQLLMYLWDGVQDDGQPKSSDWFLKAQAFAMPAFIDVKTRLYFHCAAGVNRGPSMCYFFMRTLGFPPNTAEAMIRAARPQVGIGYKKDADAAIKTLGYE